MKFLTLIRLSVWNKRTRFSQILIACELLAGLLVFYLCANLFYAARQAEQYTERYADIAMITVEDEQQVAYAQAHGEMFLPWISPTELSGAGAFFVLHDQAFYRAVRLDLAQGEWFGNAPVGSEMMAVVPYALRGKYRCGGVYPFDFYGVGTVRVYICGVLSSDVTLGDGTPLAFDDINRKIWLCDINGLSRWEEIYSQGQAYAKLTDYRREEVEALGIQTVGMEAEAAQVRRNHKMAVPAIFTAILFTLFTVAYIGDHFIRMMNQRKEFAVRFMCGLSVRRALLVQICADFAELCVPVVLSCVAARLLSVRLHAWGVLIPVLYLLVGLLVLVGITVHTFSKQSPAEMIKRRFRS